MSEQTARDSVDFMLRESGDNKVAHVTFFGGETLLNFPVLQKTIAYARQRGAELGKQVDFSLTTNGTLLKPDIIEFLAENHVGVTISIDGPKEVQDKFRVFHNGTGSYDVVAPKIKELLKRHRSRPIGARVTLTSGTMDVKRIFRHLTEEIGFWEVGFAPVTTSPEPRPRDCRSRLRRDARAVPRPRRRIPRSVGRRTGITGSRTSRRRSRRLHKGVSKAFPCGAGLGLLGVATDGDVALCHRFAGSDAHKLGTVERRHRSRCAAGVPRDRITSRTRPTAAGAGRGRSARAAAITRRTRATARRLTRTCTTATGSAAGPTSA